MRSNKGDSSASDVSASGHSDNVNKSKAIANGAAKVFNKIGLKARPSTTKGPTKETSTRFQIVHIPDKSPIDMPLPEFPTTNEEFYAAISQINGLGNLHAENAPFERISVSSNSRKGSQQSSDSQRRADKRHSSMFPRTVVDSTDPKDILPGPKRNGPLVNHRKDFDPPVPTPPVTASGKVRPAYTRRVASEGVPPRPLSERPLIKYPSLRARPNPQVQHSSMSTPSAHSALSTPNKRASSIRYGHNRVNSGEGIVRRRPRRPPSTDSSDNDDDTSSPEASPVSNTGNEKQETQDSGVEPKPRHNLIKCYFCQEDCQLGDNLCSKCQSRFQPQEEVFEYSDSEYEDIEFDDSPIFSPASEKGRGTSSRFSKRRTARHSRPREKSRGWSEFSSLSHLQQLARSASTSPTSHVAMELKIVPPTDIKVCTVTSPTRSSSGDGRSSALHHIQQALKPRTPSSPNAGGHDRDAVRLGKVRSGEIRRVDYPDIIKLKDPSLKNSKSFQKAPQEHHRHKSGDSFKSWLKYYGDGEKGSERGSGSTWSGSADLPASGRNSAVPARVSTYDRVASIYDLYASLDES